MAIYGARNSMWAPWAKTFQDTDATKLPTYDTAKTFGQLNKVVDNPNYIDGFLPGDDQIVLYKKKFKDGTVTPESVFIPIEDAATMYGASYDDKMGMSRGDDDEPPYIGYGFTTNHVSKTAQYTQVVFYPKLRATPTGKDIETRGNNINFATDKMEFHWESPACRKHIVQKDFSTEDEAIAYLKGLFDGTSAVPGLPKPA